LPAPSTTESGDNLEVAVPSAAEVDQLRIHPYGVGVDCHARFYQVTLLVRDAERDTALRYEWTVPTAVPALMEAKAKVLETLAEHDCLPPEPADDTLRYTCESSGPYHKPLLNAWGGKPSVVNPLLAGATRRKTDVLDARLLAYQSMTGIWPTSYVMPHEYEQCRHWFRAAQHWQQQERQAKQKIVNLTTMYGNTIAATGSVVKPEIRGLIEDLANATARPHPNLSPAGVPAAVGELLLEWYGVVDDAHLRAHDAWRRAKTLTDEQRYVVPTTGEVLSGRELARLLMTIPGVGERSAYILITETGTIARFPSAKAYAAFCGFDPSLKVSAGKVTSQQRRRGNLQIHTALQLAVTSLILRHSEPFGQWAYVLSKKHKKGGGRIAQAAVARRVVTAVFHCWTRGVAFDYTGYRLDQYSQIATVPVAASRLSPRVQRILTEAGYRDSAHIARKLAEVYGLTGIGARAREELDLWLSGCKAQSLAARENSSATAAAS
jgi:hypothetical protein